MLDYTLYINNGEILEIIVEQYKDKYSICLDEVLFETGKIHYSKDIELRISLLVKGLNGNEDYFVTEYFDYKFDVI